MTIAVLILFGIPAALWRGYVLSVLWGWFVVPLGAPPLSVLNAIGLVLIFGHMSSAQKAEDFSPGEAMAQTFFGPLV